MADATFSTQSQSSILANEIAECFNRSVVLAKILPVKICQNPSGPYWTANKGGATASTHAPGSTVSSFSVDEDVKVTLGMGYYEQPFKIHDELIGASMFTDNTVRKDMFASKMRESIGALGKKINQGLFNGSGSNSIIGLDSAIADDGNSYAGVNRSTEAYWRPYVSAPGVLRSITKAMILDYLAGLTNVSGERPELAVCNPLVFSKVQALFEQQIRFEPGFLGSDVPVINVNGTRFVEDSDGYAADNNGGIYFLSRPNVHIEVIPYRDGSALFDTFPVDDLGVPGAISYKKLPLAAHATSGMTRAQIQLVVTNPFKCGYLGDLNIA